MFHRAIPNCACASTDNFQKDYFRILATSALVSGNAFSAVFSPMTAELVG
jgi:hypothetical protein